MEDQLHHKLVCAEPRQAKWELLAEAITGYMLAPVCVHFENETPVVLKELRIEFVRQVIDVNQGVGLVAIRRAVQFAREYVCLDDRFLFEDERRLAQSSIQCRKGRVKELEQEAWCQSS